MTTSSFVIVGGGLAAAKLAESLRAQGFDGSITIVGSDSHLPYDRPPLSKGFLAGKKDLPDFTVKAADWYEENKVAVRTGTEAVAIDREAKNVTLTDGSVLPYDKLALATGSRSRRPPIPGSDAAGVMYLRSFDDAAALSASLTKGTRLAIIGAGWIGLEVASQAVARGVAVTIVEGAPTPLHGPMGPEIGNIFAGVQTRNGVDLRCGVTVNAITVADGVATGLRLGDGATVDADVILVAVGAAPNIEIAKSAGLAVNSGVVVDATLTTSDPDIVAVGDIAEQDHPILKQRIRVEHWANALNQPETAAKSMLGNPEPYERLPYFYTDQFDLGMEYVGYVDKYSRVVIRGDADALEFVAFWLDGGNRVLAGMQVNVWDQLDAIKGLVGKSVDPERLADTSVPLNSL